MNRSTEIEIKVGIFVSVGVALIMFTIVLLGGGRSIFQRTVEFESKFPQIEGLVEGATVKMSGVRVGKVLKIKLIKDTGQVIVRFNVNSQFRDAVRKDTSVGIQTQGVLGDRFIVLIPGTESNEIAESGSELKSEMPKEFKDYLNTADEVLGRLKNSLFQIETILSNFNRENRSDVFFKNITGLSTNLNEGTKGLHLSVNHLNSIMKKIDMGQGTIGALINDPSPYDDVKALLGGANRNRVLKYFIKKTVEDSREVAKKAKEQQAKK